MTTLEEFCLSKLDRWTGTLIIPRWPTNWEPVHSSALIEICSQLDVKHIIFCQKSFDVEFMHKFLSYTTYSASTGVFPFLHNLKSVKLERTGIHPALRCILNNSGVSTVEWFFKDSSHFTFRSDIYSVFDGFNLNEQRLFETNYYVTKLLFSVLVKRRDSQDVIAIMKYDLSARNEVTRDLSHMTRDTIDPWLARNQKGYDKCKYAIVTLLGLKKKMKNGYLLSFVTCDVVRIIAMMIWKTRGTKIWV